MLFKSVLKRERSKHNLHQKPAMIKSVTIRDGASYNKISPKTKYHLWSHISSYVYKKFDQSPNRIRYVLFLDFLGNYEKITKVLEK